MKCLNKNIINPCDLNMQNIRGIVLLFICKIKGENLINKNKFVTKHYVNCCTIHQLE